MFFIAAGLHDWMLFGKGFWLVLVYLDRHNILVWLVVVVVSWQWIWVGSISRGLGVKVQPDLMQFKIRQCHHFNILGKTSLRQQVLNLSTPITL